MRFLNPKRGLALGAAAAALVLLPRLPVQPRPGQPIDTPGWTLTDFAEHLRRCGVPLHVVPGASDGGRGNSAYLTENPDATWLAMQRKQRVVECIHEWHGTVLVWYARPDFDEPDAEWGPYGCRIGRFLLFGDEAVVRRIQEVCRG